jgi:hypothetical protein
MMKFRKLQSIALWFHIPMWILAAVVIVIMGAYHAGIRNAEAREAMNSALIKTLPLMSIAQLSQVQVRDL